MGLLWRTIFPEVGWPGHHMEKVYSWGGGYSSPVVYDNQVWVTTATNDGKELYAVCLDYLTGRTVYDIKVFSPEDVFGKNSINICQSHSMY